MTQRRQLRPVNDDDPGPGQEAPLVQPHNLAAERAALGAMLQSRQAIDDVTRVVTPGDYYAPKHEIIAQTIQDMYARLEPVETLTVADTLTRTGNLARVGGVAYLFELVAACTVPASGVHYASIVADRALRRRVWLAGERLRAVAVTDTVDPLAALTDAQDALQRVVQAVPGVEPTSPGGVDIATFLAVDVDDDPCWLIPGLLERADRLIITGPEGGGKSTLLRQTAVQAATGIHPFTMERVAPVKVLVLDLENTARQNRRKYRPLVAAAKDLDPANLILEIRTEGINLADPADEQWLSDILDYHNPDLLVTGPIYKICGGDPTSEAESRPAALALDRQLRAKRDCAVILEAHTAKTNVTTNPAKRPKEPYGWSGWLRWPEFGLHVSPDGELTRWRGDREEGREIPDRLKRGGAWPWTAVASPHAPKWAQIRGAMIAAGRILSEREIQRATGIPRSTIQRVLEDYSLALDDLRRRLPETGA